MTWSGAGVNYRNVGHEAASATLRRMTEAGDGEAFVSLRPNAAGLSLSPARQALFDAGWYAFVREERERRDANDGPARRPR